MKGTPLSKKNGDIRGMSDAVVGRSFSGRVHSIRIFKFSPCSHYSLTILTMTSTADTHTTAKPLSAEVQSLVEPGIRAAATKWNVELPANVSFVFNQKTAVALTGNRAISRRTKDTYARHYLQVWRFCAIIGDYSSMLILLQPMLHGVPAIKVETLEQFMCFKRRKNTEALVSMSNGGMPILDVFGLPMSCEGGWNQPTKAEQFKSSISILHRVREHTGPYYDVCDECYAKVGTARLVGCDRHSNQGARLFRSGNPTSHESFGNTLKTLSLEGKGYESRGADQFLPKDLRRIREYLLAQNTLVGLQTYTACLLGCKMFLRPDEVLPIRIEQFIPELFIVKNDKIIGLLVWVNGKCDKNVKKYLFIWADDDCPELCPLRHLLVYIFLAKHGKSGHLFPHAKELHSPPADGIFVTEINKDSFRSAFERIVKKALPARKFKYGLQVFRKTGYLLAIWGNGSWTLIKESARHLTDKHAKTYRKDADALKLIDDVFKDPENRVSQWKSIKCVAPNQATYLNLESSAFALPLHELARDFVVRILGFSDNKPTQFDVATVITASLAYVHKLSGGECFLKLAKEMNLSDADTDRINCCIDLVAAERLETWKAQSSGSGGLQFSKQDAVDDAALDAPIVTPASKKRKRGGGIEIHGRLLVAGIVPLEAKVAKLVELSPSVPDSPDQLTEAARTFLYRTLNPVLGCLEHHCDGNIDNFCIKWRTTFVSKFSSFCCNGKPGVQCGKTN
jgi:hypothetical protein